MTSPRTALAPRSRRSKGSKASDWVTWLVWMFIASLLVSRLLQFGGTPSRLVAIWQALLPWQLLASIIVIAVAAGFRRWMTLTVLLLAVAALMPLVIGWYLRGSAELPRNNPTISVATSNVLYDNQQLAAAFSDIAAVDADVVVMSEIVASGLAELADHPLLDRYPYRSEDPYRIGLVVLSRYPLVNDAAANWVTAESQALTLDVDGTQIRLIVSHPPPPVFNAEIWDAELEMIGNDVNAFDAPTIIAGDLNAGWVLPPFRDMMNTGDLTDAMGAVGHRWTMTWPTDGLGIPFVTLDHVLVSDQLGVFQASAFDVTGSDHRAIIAELVLPQRGAEGAAGAAEGETTS